MIHQSKIALGTEQVPQAFTSGAVVAYTAEFEIPAGVTVDSADIVELAVLPADHHVVDAQIIPSGNFGAGVTADVGIMSGDVGDADPARTSGAEVFNDAALTAFLRMSLGTAVVLAPSDTDRSIGVKFSADVVGAGQIIRLQLLLTQ